MPDHLLPSRDPSWWEGRQEILNAHPVPERRLQKTAPDPIPVRARIVWAKDGEELVAARIGVQRKTVNRYKLPPPGQVVDGAFPPRCRT